MRNKIITVFGGNGFLGRSLIQRLARQGARIRVAVRHPEKAIRLQVLGEVGQVVPFALSLSNKQSIYRALEQADYAVNLCGRLYEKGRNTFNLVHHEAPKMMAQACKEQGVQAFVHVSAIGADVKAESQYARSKGAGEQAVLKAFPDATIIRPSVIFGPDDKFFNRFARLAMISPALVVFDGGRTKMQPIFVGDVAQAIVSCLSKEDAKSTKKIQGHCFELGGPEVYSFKGLLEIILKMIDRKRPIISLPYPMGRFIGLIAQYMPDPLITPDQILLLKKDNVVSSTAKTIQDLGVTPIEIAGIVPEYLKCYRPGF